MGCLIGYIALPLYTHIFLIFPQQELVKMDILVLQWRGTFYKSSGLSPI